MALFARTLRTTVPGSTGTQDYTIAGIGTPIAVKVECNVARVDNTDSAHLGWSRGYWANNGFFACMIVQEQDNQTTGNTYSTGTKDYIAGLMAAATGAAALLGTLSAIITDGIRIDWTTVTGLAHRLTITFYYGSNVTAYCGVFDMANNTGTPNQTLDVTAPNFQPDFGEFCYFGGVYDVGFVTALNGIEAGWGMFARSSGGIQQLAVGYSHADALTTASPSLATEEAHIIRPVVASAGTTPLNTRHEIALDSVLSNGFRVKDTKGSNPSEVLYLVVKWGGRNCNIDKITSPTTAGGTITINNTKRIGYITTFSTISTAVGDRVNAQAGGIGWGVADRTTQSVWAQRNDDGATTTDNAIIARDGYAILGIDETNASRLEATVAFNDSDFVFTYPTVGLQGRIQWVLSIEDPIEGAGALPLPHFTTAATGREAFRGLSGITLPHFTVAGAGREVFRATGNCTFPSFQVAGAGKHPMRGPGAVTFPSFQVAGAGTMTAASTVGNGSWNFPSFQMSAAGREAMRGTSGLTFPSFQVAGAGREVVSGTSALQFPSFQVSTAGREAFVSTAGVVFPSFQVLSDGVSLQVVVGTSALTFPSFTAHGTGSSGLFTIAGSGMFTLPHFTVAGQGREVFRGTSALTFPSFQVSAAGREKFLGASSINFPSLQVAAAAREVFRAVGALTFPSFNVLAQGREVDRAQGSLIFPSFQVDADGNLTVQIVGTSNLVFPSFQTSSSGAQSVKGTAALTFPSFHVSGTSASLLFSVGELEGSFNSQVLLEGSIS